MTAKVSVATYDLDTVGVLQSPGYRAIGGENLSPWSKRVTSRVERLMRFEGDQILPGDALPPDNAGGLLLNAMNVEPAAEAEFNEWYNNEHIPALAAVPGVLCARRFRATAPTAAMSRSTILSRPTCRRPRPGRTRPTASGPQAAAAFPRSPAPGLPQIRPRRLTGIDPPKDRAAAPEWNASSRSVSSRRRRF